MHTPNLSATTDDTSTTAPTDMASDASDIDDREHTLRAENELLDLSWFAGLTWDRIGSLRGATFVQIPARHTFAVQQAQQAILRALLHHPSKSAAAEAAWKALMLVSWLLLAKPLDTEEGSCAQLLDERLELLWSEDWSTLWALTHGDCEKGPPRDREPDPESKLKSKARKVATLVRAGERGRALAAARHADPVPLTPAVFRELQALYPVDPDPAARITSTPISNATHHAIQAQVARTLKRMPRLSEPGPLGMRAEHWYDYGKDTGDASLLARAVAQLAIGDVPPEVLYFFRCGQIVPLPKPKGGHRPLLLTEFLRRLALKALMAVKRQSVTTAVGDLQCGVGAKDGASRMIKTIQQRAEVDHDRVLVALDIRAAFQNISRKAIIDALNATDPELAAIFSTWSHGKAKHRARLSTGRIDHITASSGVDQGDPLSSAAFAAGIANPLRHALHNIQQSLDAGAAMHLYIDDWYVWIRPEAIPAAIAHISNAIRPLGLSLETNKLQVWSASCTAPIPAPYNAVAAPTMTCLGGHLRIQGDSEPAAAHLGPDDRSLEKAINRLDTIAASIATLCQHGLKKVTANDLLSAYVGASSQHVLRMSCVTMPQATAFDDKVREIWTHLLGRPIQSDLLFAPQKMGGYGIASAVDRRAAAPWIAWQMALPDIQKHAKAPDLDNLLAQSPTLTERLRLLQTTIAEQTGISGYQVKTLSAALRTQTSQKFLISALNRKRHRAKLAAADPTSKDILLSQAALHTGSQLQQPSLESYEPDDHVFAVTAARRLMLPHPATTTPQHLPPHCPLAAANGQICGASIDPFQLHCITCKSGGGVVQRHDGFVRCLADLVQRYYSTTVLIEQVVPTMIRNGQQARMDLVYTRDGHTTYVDVAIVTPFSADARLLAQAGAKAGYMARRQEKKKFARYPNHRLVPFVLETTGRPGFHARKFVADLVADAPHPPTAAHDVWCILQNALQAAISQQQLKIVAQPNSA